MYAPYLPASASEFPNDNPELHEGARWVCQLPVGPSRAVLRASPVAPALASLQPASLLAGPQAAAQWRPVAPPVRSLRLLAPLVSAAPRAPRSAPEAEAPLSAVAARAPLAAEPFALEADATPPASPTRRAPVTPVAAPPLLESTGPLQLDLSRIVLPHRVADVPPPPAFIFRPLPSSRRAAAARALAQAAPALAPLGYRVVDGRDARRRVQRGWRVDVAPCLAVAGSPLGVVPVESESAPSSTIRALPASMDAPPASASELIAQILVEASTPLPGAVAAAQESAAVQLIAAVLSEASALPDASLAEQSPASGRRRKAPVESKKKQRRRAVRVASSASLVTAALPGNEELSRTLTALDQDFAERRLEQPAASRKRRGRRGSGSGSARPKRAANAV